MNNEIAPVLDMLEELKQECKAISKAQAELHTALAEQPANSKSERDTTQETVQIHLSKETQAKIKEHQLFVLEALSQSNKKLDPKFETLQQLIKEQQKPVEYKNFSLFASIQLSERIPLSAYAGQSYRQRLRASRQPFCHASQSEIHPSVRAEGYQLRTSPATASRVADGTETYPTRARRIEEAFEGIADSPK